MLLSTSSRTNPNARRTSSPGVVKCLASASVNGLLLAVAVHRGRAGLGGIGDQHVGAGRLDLGKALPDRARGERALHALGKGIVAAGIEDHEPQLLGGLDREQHAVQRKRLVIDVGVAFEPGVHRDQIIGAVDLHAVAGIIDHGDIGIAGHVGKIAQRAAGLGGRQIVAGIDHVEAGVLQRRRDHGAVIDRVRKRCGILVGGIADHQRHALFGKGRLAHQQQRRGKKKPTQSRISGPDHHDAFDAAAPMVQGHPTRSRGRFCEPDHEPVRCREAPANNGTH